MNFRSFQMSRTGLIHIVTLVLVLFYNLALFRQFFTIYPLSATHTIYMLSLALVLAAIIEIILHTVCIWRGTRPMLILILMLSALASYFMDTYSVVLDSSMLSNVMATNSREAGDLFSFKLLFYISILGILPAFLIYQTKVKFRPWKSELFASGKIVLVALVMIAAQGFMFGKFYSSFFREHKEVRVYANPIMYMYSAYRYSGAFFNQGDKPLTELGLDAHKPNQDAERELIILVVGETARGDKFSLNGYSRKTNPLLEKEELYSFANVESCGTSTAVSVPCMFSHLKGSDFDIEKGKRSENLLDVLKHSGANILWRDNNSDSKDVALRVEYEDFSLKKNNPVCDIECRDIGMLHGLQEYIESKKSGDIVIVLHQMGNHGPDYYKRYPPEFERFKPVCRTNLLEECSSEEITNTYDNAILYTDYFLSETIQFLKKYTNRFETAMVYISDHGESLGEKGIYLHGMPNFMAPEVQRKVAAIMWFGESYDDIDKVALKNKQHDLLSHDHIFHTLLGLLEIDSSVYDKSMDIVVHKEEKSEFALDDLQMTAKTSKD